MTTSIEVSENTFNYAVREFEANKAKLYRPDGKPIYGPKEHAERLTALLERPRAALGAIEAEHPTVIAENEKVQLSQHLDPILSLNDGEITRANALRGFVADSVTETPLPELAQMLKAVLVLGGKPERALYARAAKKKVDALIAAHRTDRSIDITGSSFVLEEVGKLLQSLADPKTAEAIKAAGDQIEKAHAILHNAKVTLRRLDGREAQAQEQSRALYQANF
jgi:hypothetical protein